MKRTIWLVLGLALVLPGWAAAAMDSYCSAPPYVTRTIAPNIMVLMDNSTDMMQPAYTGNYTPNATKDNYIGYFVPTSCYSYSGKFIEELAAPVPAPGDPVVPPDCTAAAPFRGNLLNWATMSKYDVLQKVLIGGNSTSKQGNANTLLSIGGAFTPDKVHEGCIFKVSNANLTITEANAGDCRLLNNPAEVIAAQPRRDLPSIGELLRRLPPPDATIWSQIAAARPVSRPESGTAKTPDAPRSALAAAIAAVGGAASSAELAGIWEGMSLVGNAWAAACPAPSLDMSSSLVATVGQSYTLRLNSYDSTASGNVVTWTVVAKPAWLNVGPSYVNTPKTTNYGIVWSGTPTAEGTATVTVRYSATKCSPATADRSFTINIGVAPLQIDQPLANAVLPTGTVGVPYNYSTTSGQGGVPQYDADGNPQYVWSMSPVPAGLSMAAATGYITGTPTAVFNNTVTFTMRDNAGTTPVSRDVTLSIVANDLTIVTSTLLPRAVLNQPYPPFQMQGTGGGGAPYTWSIASGSFPAGITMSAGGLISGTPTVDIDTSALVLRLTDKFGNSVQKTFSFNVDAVAAAPTMMSRVSPLAAAARGELFTFQLEGAGGSPPYTWTLISTTAPGLTMTAGGLVNWDIPQNQAEGSYTLTVSMRDSLGVQSIHVATGSTTPAHRIDVVRALSVRSSSFNVKVDIDEEPLTDSNGNDIWDSGEAYTDLNANGKWDGKQGLFQKYWSEISPRARWGMAKFGNQPEPEIATCVPASPVSSWYTGIQNATSTASSPLATGLHATINYYDNSQVGYRGCTSSDPLDDVPCRKNFILVISSGATVTGTALDAGTTGCSQTDALVKNACVGFKSDLRDAAGKQNVYTYVVNTMGTTNNAILQAAALAGGGKYYDASDASTLESQLITAFQDILAQAASGTAVSVLTTSSRGIGSMVQAYFLPVRIDGTREVRWTGYTQDLWIDPQDNLREDTVQNMKLDIAAALSPQDKVVKLFFDTANNETKVARFTTDADGSGGTLQACTAGEIEPFSATKYLWEAGQELALTDPDDRDLMTATKVVHGTSTIQTFADPTNLFTTNNILNVNATLRTALNADATYTAEKIVRYVRGEDLESSDANFRDRRLTVDNALHVWKLGDIISSTPKVFANTPANSYHIDYGDSTYYSYITSAGYKERSSVAFVGANDGVLHAFRVGYLQDTGLTGTVKGIFKNFFATDPDAVDRNNLIGKEMWGYIPFNAFPYLRYLADPAYCHIYFNDLSVRIVDASIGDPADATDITGNPKNLASWRSILIGGMRFGGACDASIGGLPQPPLAGVGYSAYYAIDITDPAAPIPLWEFSDPDLGYATSFPSIVRTGGKDFNGNWYVAVGSGSSQLPKASTDLARSAEGYVYFIDLKSGALVKKVGLGHAAIVGDIVAIDSAKDASVDNLYFGTAYSTGIVNGVTTWGGKLMRLNVAGNVPGFCGSSDVLRTAAQCGTAEKILFTGAYPFTASPDVSRDPSGNIWLYAGAGKYVSDLDESDSDNKIFVGIKTTLADASYPITVPVPPATDTDFIDRTDFETTGEVTSTRFECLYNPAGSGATQFSQQEVVTGITPSAAMAAVTVPNKGWYIFLRDGERVISRPLAVGGLVDFLTYKPDSDICSYGGSSYLYAVDYLKGIAPTNVAIRAPGVTTSTTTGANATTGDVRVSNRVLLGPGAPPTGEAITIPPPKEGQEQLKKKIQVATGVIVETENTPVISTISKVVHWLKK